MPRVHCRSPRIQARRSAVGFAGAVSHAATARREPHGANADPQRHPDRRPRRRPRARRRRARRRRAHRRRRPARRARARRERRPPDRRAGRFDPSGLHRRPRAHDPGGRRRPGAPRDPVLAALLPRGRTPRAHARRRDHDRAGRGRCGPRDEAGRRDRPDRRSAHADQHGDPVDHRGTRRFLDAVRKRARDHPDAKPPGASQRDLRRRRRSPRQGPRSPARGGRRRQDLCDRRGDEPDRSPRVHAVLARGARGRRRRGCRAPRDPGHGPRPRRPRNQECGPGRHPVDRTRHLPRRGGRRPDGRTRHLPRADAARRALGDRIGRSRGQTAPERARKGARNRRHPPTEHRQGARSGREDRDGNRRRRHAPRHEPARAGADGRRRPDADGVDRRSDEDGGRLPRVGGPGRDARGGCLRRHRDRRRRPARRHSPARAGRIDPRRIQGRCRGRRRPRTDRTSARTRSKNSSWNPPGYVRSSDPVRSA